MHSFTIFLTIVVFLVWCEINFVKCGDLDLEFWQRDPRFDLRRVNEKIKKHKIGDFRDVASSAKVLLEKHLLKSSANTQRRPKLEPIQSHYKKPHKQGRHHNNRQKPRWPKPKIRPSKSYKSDEFSSKLFQDFETTRSKLRKRLKQKSNEVDVELESTKITPVYLREKTKDPKYLKDNIQPDSFLKGKPEKHKSTKVTPVYLRYPVYLREKTKDPKYLRDKIQPDSFLKAKPEKHKSKLKTQKHDREQTHVSKETDHKKMNALSPTLTPYNIKRHLDALDCKFPKANIIQEVIGKTLSFHDIILLKISEKKSDLDYYFRADDTHKFAEEGSEKKTVLIVHGLSVMGLKFMDCFMNASDFVDLLGYYLMHLDKFNIFVVPIANPDGSRQVIENKLWNKNMSPQKVCAGVALDRNFDVSWNETRDISPCSQQYPGAFPFSEPESQAVREVIHRYSNKIVAYFHVHAGTYRPAFFKGDAVLYPKGYTDSQSEDDKYIDLRGEIDEAMQLAGFQVMSVAVDTLYNWYGKVTGTSVDYATTVYGIPYAMELVMQPYSEIAVEKAALEEIWQRVINVTLCNIYRNAGK